MGTKKGDSLFNQDAWTEVIREIISNLKENPNYELTNKEFISLYGGHIEDDEEICKVQSILLCYFMHLKGISSRELSKDYETLTQGCSYLSHSTINEQMHKGQRYYRALMFIMSLIDKELKGRVSKEVKCKSKEGFKGYK